MHLFIQDYIFRLISTKKMMNYISLKCLNIALVQL